MLEMSWILIVEAIRTGSCHVVFRSVSLCHVELGECRGAISRAHESTSGELLVRQDHHHPDGWLLRGKLSLTTTHQVPKVRSDLSGIQSRDLYSSNFNNVPTRRKKIRERPSNSSQILR